MIKPKKKLIKLTEEERASFINTIDYLTDLANVARTKGILYLSEYLEEHEDNFTKKYLKIMIDDCVFEAAKLKRMMQNEIKSYSDLTTADLHEFDMIIEAILMITKGGSPKIIQDKMLTYLNET